MFCPQCGSKLPEGNAFCIHCGAKTPFAATQPDFAQIAAGQQAAVQAGLDVNAAGQASAGQVGGGVSTAGPQVGGTPMYPSASPTPVYGSGTAVAQPAPKKKSAGKRLALGLVGALVVLGVAVGALAATGNLGGLIGQLGIHLGDSSAVSVTSETQEQTGAEERTDANADQETQVGQSAAVYTVSHEVTESDEQARTVSILDSLSESIIEAHTPSRFAIDYTRDERGNVSEANVEAVGIAGDGETPCPYKARAVYNYTYDEHGHVEHIGLMVYVDELLLVNYYEGQSIDIAAITKEEIATLFGETLSDQEFNAWVSGREGMSFEFDFANEHNAEGELISTDASMPVFDFLVDYNYSTNGVLETASLTGEANMSEEDIESGFVYLFYQTLAGLFLADGRLVPLPGVSTVLINNYGSYGMSYEEGETVTITYARENNNFDGAERSIETTLEDTQITTSYEMSHDEANNPQFDNAGNAKYYKREISYDENRSFEWSAEYDTEGRLASTQKAYDDGRLEVTTFEYDGEGNRVNRETVAYDTDGQTYLDTTHTWEYEPVEAPSEWLLVLESFAKQRF